MASTGQLQFQVGQRITTYSTLARRWLTGVVEYVDTNGSMGVRYADGSITSIPTSIFEPVEDLHPLSPHDGHDGPSSHQMHSKVSEVNQPSADEDAAVHRAFRQKREHMRQHLFMFAKL
eukprot:gnl/TRDRNA2_/TRDRNA2_40518_c0_seq1.p2 gnl/TRDRNA2_/TRDRNA2_40518_c0~~gnl/TRDRNA2_/TRDRNA2_40518_c0_seq1.p2  ORF type:complete len:119 (+),score=17.18 gnl/TRDRNA2_/TRDRNA2_40518_c0_seq1:71-427(+)